jgi:hypothetical protein
VYARLVTTTPSKVIGLLGVAVVVWGLVAYEALSAVAARGL